MSESIFCELERRGLVAQMTHPQEIKDLLANQKITFYTGYDATADSLHVGHFLQLMVMSHMQKAGHHPIVLLGTGTTKIGDPTGKASMRPMLSDEAIEHNAECFRRQMSRFLDFSEGGAQIVKNGDWLCQKGYLEMLREVGADFSVNKMLTADCFRTRMEAGGLSFLEFNYMILQSYDFYHLFKEKGCVMQLGGNDQWSNIIWGMDLIRRKLGKEAYGMTFTLLTTKEGKKMGKTEGGAVWLDAAKTSPYDFFQYWRNVADADVINCLKMITFVPVEEIEAMESWEGSKLNTAKELLAFEVTKLVHGEEEANKALRAAKAVFAGSGEDSEMPTTELDEADIGDEASVIELLVTAKLAPSKGEARRLIQQGGISLGDEKVTDIGKTVTAEELKEGVVLRKGKKVFHKVIIK